MMKKNQPIRSKDFQRWIKEAWTKAQDEAWGKTKAKLSQPSTMAVLRRMKDR